MSGVWKRAENWKPTSPVDGREEQSEDSNDGDGSDVDEDREDGGVGSDVYYIDEDGEVSISMVNLLAVSQTNWRVISGTAGNCGERQKLKCYQ